MWVFSSEWPGSATRKSYIWLLSETWFIFQCPMLVNLLQFIKYCQISKLERCARAIGCPYESHYSALDGMSHPSHLSTWMDKDRVEQRMPVWVSLLRPGWDVPSIPFIHLGGQRQSGAKVSVQGVTKRQKSPGLEPYQLDWMEYNLWSNWASNSKLAWSILWGWVWAW